MADPNAAPVKMVGASGVKTMAEFWKTIAAIVDVATIKFSTAFTITSFSAFLPVQIAQ
jgi:hypothetical protein